MKITLVVFILQAVVIPTFAAPVMRATMINKEDLERQLPSSHYSIEKREDSVDRAQDAQIGGALRGFVVPDLFGIIPTSPLGGQPPDDD
jgi:hypothetical protein